MIAFENDRKTRQKTINNPTESHIGNKQQLIFVLILYNSTFN